MKKTSMYLRHALALGLTGLFTSLYAGGPATAGDPTALGDTREPGGTVRIALLLDTSNSMDGLINQAKAQLWDIVNQFTHARCGDDRRPGLQIALYQYGNDGLPAHEGYIQQVIGFTSDLDEISEKLFSLSTNGGEEFCGQVIQTSLGQLDWGHRSQDLKMIFIAGNEPFTQGRLDYRNAVDNAREKDVIVNTIFCGGYTEGINGRWKDGADRGGGEYMAIDHNRQVVHIVTPYDDLILQLNTRLNGTYISYGSRGAGKQRQQAAQDANAMELEPAVAVERTVSKSSALYSNPSWDLVDAAAQPGFKLSGIDKEQLPSELRNKSEKEIRAYIASKKEEREALNREIHSLQAKRETFLAREQASAQGELESAMIRAIKKQAEEKDYHWE